MAERTFKFNSKPIPVTDIPKLIKDLEKLHKTVTAVKEQTPKPPMKIKVTYEDGSTFTTASLADIKEAEKMYVGKEMEASDGRKLKATSVEEVKENTGIKNLDKIKGSIGETVYNHIQSLDKPQLEKQLSELKEELKLTDKNSENYRKLKDEEFLLLYRLERSNEFKEAPKPTFKSMLLAHINPAKNKSLYEKLIKPIREKLNQNMKAGTYTKESAQKYYMNVVNVGTQEVIAQYKVKSNITPTEKLEIVEKLMSTFPVVKPKVETKPKVTSAPSLFENERLMSVKKKIKENCLTRNEYDRAKVRQALKKRMFKYATEAGIEAQWYNVLEFLEGDGIEFVQLDLENTPELIAIDKAGTEGQDITSDVIKAVESLPTWVISNLWEEIAINSDYWDESNGHPGN